MQVPDGVLVRMPSFDEVPAAAAAVAAVAAAEVD